MPTTYYRVVERREPVRRGERHGSAQPGWLSPKDRQGCPSHRNLDRGMDVCASGSEDRPAGVGDRADERRGGSRPAGRLRGREPIRPGGSRDQREPAPAPAGWGTDGRGRWTNSAPTVALFFPGDWWVESGWARSVRFRWGCLKAETPAHCEKGGGSSGCGDSRGDSQAGGPVPGNLVVPTGFEPVSPP